MMRPTKPPASKESSSFRDPSGFVFRHAGKIFRQVNHACQQDFDHLMSSGLYGSLVESRLLVPHDEVDLAPADPASAYKVIQPEPIPFISFPYEWSFSAFRQAALTTLHIQELALDHGMILKDASAYNIQFLGGKPVLIDTLSFQRRIEGRPWDGYRQFCQHFLAPLALMSYKNIQLSKLLMAFIDGVPLHLASTLLPWKTYLKPSLLTHIHFHSQMQDRATRGSENVASKTPGRVSINALKGLNQNLHSAISSLKWTAKGTSWGDYYDTFSYSPDSVQHKESIVKSFLERSNPAVVWDLGANTGRFSRIASNMGILTISMDIDPGAVEQSYQQVWSKSENHLLPLVMDLTNPSPSLGWRSRERFGLLERGPVDAIMALALIHHLAIGNNVPLGQIAEFLADLCQWLLIEFVPKEDVQVQRMLSVREDIFESYTENQFMDAFSRYFKIIDTNPIQDSARTLYTMKNLRFSPLEDER